MPPALGRGCGILQTSHVKVMYFSIVKSNKIKFAECFNDFFLMLRFWSCALELEVYTPFQPLWLRLSSPDSCSPHSSSA